MPNLFPEADTTTTTTEEQETSTQVNFGRSFYFDFNEGEFIKTATGKLQELDDIDAWVEWCRKALKTARYRYLAYTRSYGQEFEDLISRHLTREGNESEIKRLTTECLMLDPRTQSVDNFVFEWNGNEVYFTFEVTNVRNETVTLTESVVIE